MDYKFQLKLDAKIAVSPNNTQVPHYLILLHPENATQGLTVKENWP